MIQMAKIKKTGQQVKVLGSGDKKGYTMVVINNGGKTKKGNYGQVVSVRNDNLEIERQEITIA